jgi:hypothetical protein
LSPEEESGLATVLRVARALAAAGAPFAVGGSFASSVLGIPRSTLDVDLVARLEPAGVGRFLAALGSGFYADEERIRHGVERRTSFNVVDLASGFKADVYLVGGDELSAGQLARATPVEIAPGERVPVLSAEDVILQKLRWFRMGGEVSERQWLDVLGVLKVQRGALQDGYLERWARALGLEDLLRRARSEAGI